MFWLFFLIKNLRWFISQIYYVLKSMLQWNISRWASRALDFTCSSLELCRAVLTMLAVKEDIQIHWRSWFVVKYTGTFLSFYWSFWHIIRRPFSLLCVILRSFELITPNFVILGDRLDHHFRDNPCCNGLQLLKTVNGTWISIT